MRNRSADWGIPALGQIFRRTRESGIDRCHWRKEGKAGDRKFCHWIDLSSIIRLLVRDTGVSMGAEESGKESCVRSMSEGVLGREGDGYEYPELVKFLKGKYILMKSLYMVWNSTTPSLCLYIKHVCAWPLEAVGETCFHSFICYFSDTYPYISSLLSVYKLIVVYLAKYLELEAKN